MSIIYSLRKRAISLALSLVLISSGAFSVSFNALEPSKNFFSFNLHRNSSQPSDTISRIEHFWNLSPYLGREINFKLDNSLYLADLYIIAYQAVQCLKIYKIVDPWMFNTMKKKIFRDTLDLVKIFDTILKYCPYKDNKQMKGFQNITALKEFLTSIGAGEKEWDGPESLTSKYPYVHFKWRLDSNSKIFMVFSDDHSHTKEIFRSLRKIVKRINKTSLALRNCIVRKNTTTFEKRFAPFIPEDIFDVPKFKNFIRWTTANLYKRKIDSTDTQDKLSSVNFEPKYEKIDSGLTKLTVDDYINIVLLSIFDYEYIEDPTLHEKEDDATHRQAALRDMMFLISYYDAAISCAELDILPSLRNKISEIENELECHNTDILSQEDKALIEKASKKITQIVQNHSDFYAQNLKNGFIPIEIAEDDPSYSETSDYEKSSIHLVHTVIDVLLKKCMPLFTSRRFIDYATKPIHSTDTTSELDASQTNYPWINPLLTFFARGDSRFAKKLNTLQDQYFLEPNPPKFPFSNDV